MTKWLRKNGVVDEFRLKDDNGAVYSFYGQFWPNGEVNNNYTLGTAVPDHVAERLLRSGEYVEVNSEWHKAKAAEKDKALVEKYLKNVPQEVQSIMFRTRTDSLEAHEEAVKGKRKKPGD